VGSENALKVEKPREVLTLSRTNPSGSAKGYGWDLGIKPLKRRFKADEVLEKSARTEGTSGNWRHDQGSGEKLRRAKPKSVES
jgi:hypothetical protein